MTLPANRPLELAPPATGVHRLNVVAKPDDIDELGHVSNLVFLRWVLEVALSHSDAAGFRHPEYRELGAIFVVRRHNLEYLRPVFNGDQLELSTWVDGFRAASSERHTRMVRAADGLEVARATTLWAFVTLDGGRPRRIPGHVKAAFTV